MGKKLKDFLFRKKGAEDSYVRRASLFMTVLAGLFLIEICVLTLHSGVMASGNSSVSSWREEAMAECDKKSVTMGDILDRNGTPLVAFRKPMDRGTYADPRIYSNVIGFTADSPFGLFKKYTQVLRKTPTVNDTKGNSLVLTLDHELQQETSRVLTEAIGKNSYGSMVVMDAETGEILSMVSLPTFDMTNFETEMKQMSQSKQVWYPLATTGVIAPGSTCKVLTSIALLENGMETHTEPDQEVQAGNHVIHNYYGNRNLQIDYTEALRISSNVFFARSVLSMDDAEEKLTDVAKRLFIGTDLNLDFGTVTSNWSLDEEVLKQLRKNPGFSNDYVLAATAFGQSEVRFSTLNGAMLAASIINDGKLVTPYMIEKVVDCNGQSVNLDKLDVEGLTSGHGKLLSKVTTPAIAGKIRSAMENAAIKSYQFDKSLKIAAKSGTSETGNSGNAGNNAWMISCANIQGHKYAVAINWARAGSGVTGKYMKKPVQAIYNYLNSKEAISR